MNKDFTPSMILLTNILMKVTINFQYLNLLMTARSVMCMKQ